VRWLLSEKRLATGGELLCFLTAGHHEEAVVELLCLAVARKMFSSGFSILGVCPPTDGIPCLGAVYLNGSYSSSSCSQGAGTLPGGGGGGAALGISADCLGLGGGCEGKGGGIARGAADCGSGGGAPEGDMTGDRSSKLDSLAF